MAYVKQTWENLPSTNTPITAERLNHMEDGIAGAWEHGGGAIDVYNEYNDSTQDTYSCNFINNMTSGFSTTEQKVSKWIDDKDIYSVTLAITSGFSASFPINISQYNIDKVLRLEASFDYRRTDVNVYYTLYNNMYGASDDYFRIIRRKESSSSPVLQVYLGNTQVSKGDNRLLVVTIYYTKTS